MRRYFRFSAILVCLSCSILEAYAHQPSNHDTAIIESPTKTQSANNPINDPNFSLFTKAVSAAGLKDIFDGTGPFTAFVPNNAAFEKLGKEKVEVLFKPENKDDLASLVMYHIVHGKYLANTLKTKSFKTLNGKNIEVVVSNDTIKVNGANVLRTDLTGPYGVIHEIDTVLVP